MLFGVINATNTKKMGTKFCKKASQPPLINIQALDTEMYMDGCHNMGVQNNNKLY